MSTTPLEAWGTSKDAAAEGDFGTGNVTELDLAGGGIDGEAHLDGGAQPDPQAMHADHLEGIHAQGLPKKGISKNAKIGFGVLGLGVIFLAGTHFMGQGDVASGPAHMAESDVVAPIAAPRVAPAVDPLDQASGAAAVAAPASAGAGAWSAPASQPPASAPAPQATGFTQTGQAAPPAAATAPVQGVAVATPPVAAAPAPSADALRAQFATLERDLRDQIEELKRQVQTSKEQVESYKARIARIEKDAARAQANKPVTTAVATSKPAATVESEAKQAKAAAPAVDAGAARPQVAKATVPATKVRSDYRVYAAVDGRVWVVGRDGEPTMVDVRSVLSDGSRIIKINADVPVVETSAGEIR